MIESALLLEAVAVGGEEVGGLLQAAKNTDGTTNLSKLPKLTTISTLATSLAKAVKVNVLIYSMLEYENMNSVYREFFPTDPPARTVCGAKLIGGHKVEIECVALA